MDHNQLIQEINDSRASQIKEIESMLRLVLDKHSKMQKDNFFIENRSKNDIFTDYCLYLDYDTIKDLAINKYRLGILIKTDFFISENQTEFLK